jgi:hypothetical protein
MASLIAMVLGLCQHSTEPHLNCESLDKTQIDLKLTQTTALVTGGAGCQVLKGCEGFYKLIVEILKTQTHMRALMTTGQPIRPQIPS